ncbi:MAG: hypothetical protein ACXWUG_05440 [Polyangiales bacterium]
MKNALGVLVLAALGLGAFGCTPSPEKTCEKLQKLAEEESSKKSGDKPFVLSMDKCLSNMNEMKERDPEAYKCTAKVIAKLSNLDTAFLAISVCDKNKPKKDKDKGDKDKGDDDDKDTKKKKKKSDDD